MNQVAFGLFTQSPTANNNTLYQRFNAFLDNFQGKLKTVTEDEFAQIKEAHIANYLAKPTSLAGEFGYLTKEWLSIKADINSKAEYIKVLQSVALKDVQDFYEKVLISDKNKQLIVVQVRGKSFIEAPLLSLEKQININNIDELDKK
ncbi:hypothetical protein ACLKMH_04280 [Psychromonas sp. KJ10-10]|uniref:hypothetical protein n=1 Tax=Psychromonas sp. KJ10-10 TaxID=3391823 RepID=UPI0039B6A4EE